MGLKESIEVACFDKPVKRVLRDCFAKRHSLEYNDEQQVTKVEHINLTRQVTIVKEESASPNYRV